MNPRTQPTDQANQRYARQIRLPEIGLEGQHRLANECVLIVGCGALGSTLANLLVRAGIGSVRIVDRDVLELNNLQRQVIFDEEDVRTGLPKAEAAAAKLRRINSEVDIDPRVEDVTPRNIENLMDGAAVILDGTDNYETRYLINDACVKHGTPWIYGGVIGTTGMSMNVIPGRGPCLRCVFPESPPAGSVPTCETAGILNTLPATIASIQTTECVKLLCGTEPSDQIVYVDLWQQSYRQVSVGRDDNCSTCVQRKFEYLSAEQTAWTTTLCGRNAVQITPSQHASIDLGKLSEHLADLGGVSLSGSVLRFAANDCELLVFADGRAMVNGTDDEKLARSLYARYIGS